MARPKAAPPQLASYTVKPINRTPSNEKPNTRMGLLENSHPFTRWLAAYLLFALRHHDLPLLTAGDCVLMRPSDPSKPPSVARIERLEADSRGSNVKVYVRWYYRPEESIGGSSQFHGSKEVFLSDHYDFQSADTIEGKCTVHTFKSYTKLDTVGNADFFCRFRV